MANTKEKRVWRQIIPKNAYVYRNYAGRYYYLNEQLGQEYKDCFDFVGMKIGSKLISGRMK